MEERHQARKCQQNKYRSSKTAENKTQKETSKSNRRERYITFIEATIRLKVDLSREMMEGRR